MAALWFPFLPDSTHLTSLLFLCLQVGILAEAGNGRRIEAELSQDPSILVKQRVELNQCVLKRLEEDKWAEELWQMCADDAAEERMTYPEMLTSKIAVDTNLVPRFCVEQGTHISSRALQRGPTCHCSSFVPGWKADGSTKLRAIDDFSCSQANMCTTASEKLRCDTLDTLLQVLRKQMELCKVAHFTFCLAVFLPRCGLSRVH